MYQSPCVSAPWFPICSLVFVDEVPLPPFLTGQLLCLDSCVPKRLALAKPLCNLVYGEDNWFTCVPFSSQTSRQQITAGAWTHALDSSLLTAPQSPPTAPFCQGYWNGFVIGISVFILFVLDIPHNRWGSLNNVKWEVILLLKTLQWFHGTCSFHLDPSSPDASVAGRSWHFSFSHKSVCV